MRSEMIRHGAGRIVAAILVIGLAAACVEKEDQGIPPRPDYVVVIAPPPFVFVPELEEDHDADIIKVHLRVTEMDGFDFVSSHGGENSIIKVTFDQSNEGYDVPINRLHLTNDVMVITIPDVDPAFLVDGTTARVSVKLYFRKKATGAVEPAQTQVDFRRQDGAWKK